MKIRPEPGTWASFERNLKRVDLGSRATISSDFGMLELMRELRMSRTQIYRKVKVLTGKSPTVFIRSIRLHHGKKLLEQSEMNVSEIAYETGFRSPSYFSKLFLEEFGTTPSVTRK